MSPRRTLAVLLIGACAGALGETATAGAASANPETGKRVFASKQCIGSHALHVEQGAGPTLEEIRQPQRAMELAGRQGIPYPRFSGGEMGNLLAFLKSAAVATKR